MRFKQTANSIISCLRLFSSLNWRKTTAILLCLALAFGHIPASAAVLSDQVLDSIVGFGLGEAVVEANSAESDVKANSSKEVSEDVANTYTLQQTNEPVSDVSEPVLSGMDEALSDKPLQQDVSASEENKSLINDSAEKDETDSEYSNIESTEEYTEETTETGTQASSEEPAIIDEIQQEENINQTNESETLLNETILSDDTQSPEETHPEEQTEQSEQPGDEPGQELITEEITEEITPIAEGMVLQSTAYTCGPAALATLLKILGSDNNYYEKITQLVQIVQNGSSLLDLKRSAETLGYQAEGYKKTINELAFSGPVLAHVIINDYHHFTVVEGMSDRYVFLADPTLGQVSMPLEQFKKIWNGVTLKVSKTNPDGAIPIVQKDEQVLETDEHHQTNADKSKSVETVPLAEVIVISSTDEPSSKLTVAFETPGILDENDIIAHEIQDVGINYQEKELLEETENPINTAQSAKMLSVAETSGIQHEQTAARGLSIKTDAILDLHYERTESEKQSRLSSEKDHINNEQKAELPEKALTHQIENSSAEELEKYTTKCLIPSNQLDETEMMSIRGRAIFLIPLAIKAVKLAPAVIGGTKVFRKAAPAVTSGVQTFKKTTMANARSIGIAGERAVGITGHKTRIMMPNGKTRVPDFIDTTRGVLTEVKNVRSLNFTRQLRDYHTFAQNNRLTFELFVRSDTKLSRPLQNAINQGTIIRRNIPRF